MCRCASIGGKARRLGLQWQPHLEKSANIVRVGQARWINTKGLTFVRGQNVSTEALARTKNSIGSKTGNRFTYDISTDIELQRKFLLLRKPVTRPESATVDLLADQRGHTKVQRLRSIDLAEDVFAWQIADPCRTGSWKAF